MYINKKSKQELVRFLTPFKNLIKQYEETKIGIDFNKIIVYDIETAGINALNADLGFAINFGYITLADFIKGKKVTVLSIADYKVFYEDPHDDSGLVKDAMKVLHEANGIIHHYGDRFDEPFLRTRSAILRAKGHQDILAFPDTKGLDTCKLLWRKYKLSSNRLANACKIFNCYYRKVDKHDGWPAWWYAYLKGDDQYDEQMRHYCGFDVMTLAEVALYMFTEWNKEFCNKITIKPNNKPNIIRDFRCVMCGHNELTKQDKRVYGGKLCQRYLCRGCGSTRTYVPI